MDWGRRQRNDEAKIKSTSSKYWKKEVVEIGEIVGTGRAEDDVEALNGESDEVDGDLQ